MKKLLSILLALVLCVGLLPAVIPTAEAADVTINATNFPDEAFRAYVSEKADYNHDGILSDVELAAVKSVDVSDRDIGDLTGIRFFTSMTTLNCRSNRLVTLNLSGMDTLTTLTCKKNQLTALNVQGCTALTYLDCGDNALAALDLSDAAALETLLCTTNDLSELDLTANTALKTLGCGSNPLTGLDLCRNKALKALSCAGCYQLESIDVRNLSSLSDMNLSGNTALETLKCSGCALTDLEVGSCTGLTYLSCYNNRLTKLNVAYNRQLTYLDCDGNLLTGLGVGYNTALETLYCSGNQLAALNVSRNPELADLRCYDNQLTELDVSANAKLTYLDVDYNQLTELDVSANALLEVLNCSYNQLTELDVSNSEPLTHLRCYANSLTSLNIGNNPALRYLDCEYNALAKLDISACVKLVNAYLYGERTELNGTSGVFVCYSCDDGYIYMDPDVPVNTVPKPTITTQPKSQTASPDTTVKFTVKVGGEGLKYQWYYRTSSTGTWAKSTLTGAKTATLTVKATAARNGYQYKCRVSNEGGYVYSKPATLTVASKPTITTQPKSQTAAPDTTVKFTVKAAGGSLSYQWYYRTSSTGTWKKSTLTGAKTAALSVKATEARNGYQYKCRVSNAAGYAYSAAATLTVSAKPVITTQPKSQTASAGATVKFTVKADGATTYQWYYRTSSSGTWAKSTLTGAKTATLTVKATDARDGYQYKCRVSNAEGYVYTNAVTLTVA